MNDALTGLIELQACDSELVKLARKTGALPEKIRQMDERFEAYRVSVEGNKRNYDALKALHSECEGRIKKINDQMIKTKEKLLEVKNNKEYQAMLKEVESAEATRGDVETQTIALLDQMEQLAPLIRQDEATLAQAQTEHERERKTLENELGSVDSDVETWTKRRDQVQSLIPGDVLSRYERVKKRNGGVGVISVWKAVCGGCYMNIPPQLYNELQRSDDLMSCPNCNRIMYYSNPEANP